MLMAWYNWSYEQAGAVELWQMPTYVKAHNVKSQQDEYNAAIGAWLGEQVKATKGKGKHVRSAYKSFNDFYDNEKAFNSLFDGTVQEVQEPGQPRRLTLADKNRILNKHRKEEEHG